MLRLQRLSAFCSSCGEQREVLLKYGRLQSLPNRLGRHQIPRHKAWLQCQGKRGRRKRERQSRGERAGD